VGFPLSSPGRLCRGRERCPRGLESGFDVAEEDGEEETAEPEIAAAMTGMAEADVVLQLGEEALHYSNANGTRILR